MVLFKNSKRVTAALLLLVMLLNVILPVSVSAEEVPFTCWTMNGENKIDGVLTDGKYVLSVPYDADAANVIVYFTGGVTAASAGTLGEGTVTGAFVGGTEVTLTVGEENCVVTLVKQEPPVVEEPFTCWIMNGEDKVLGELSDTDGKYHLAVPSSIKPAETVLNFTGTVTGASAGTVGESTVTGAFAADVEVTLTGSDAGTTYVVVLDPYAVGSEDFTCFTYDEKGNQINAWWSAEDSKWYLFVPSTVSISDMTLSYTGLISSVTEGKLNMFESEITDAFSQSGDAVTMRDKNGKNIAVQVMQSNLPSVHVVLNGKTLADVHADKDTKHKNNSVYIMDPSGTYDLTVEGSVEVKGRGNTTWKLFDKKGYQLKFDSKTSVMGMGKAKKWVLLANAGDDSMMRTTLTYRMADNLDMGFVPQMEYVDLWVNGEYLGTYIIGDKVEPGSSRVDLKEDTGVLFEQDNAYYAEEDYWFYSETLQRYFVMKEIVDEKDACIEAAMTDFEAAVDELTKYLYYTPADEATLEDLSSMIDVDSFIKYYLVSEYVLNPDAVLSSFYWYKDGADDVIHLGPLWDYDTCMGNDGTKNTENLAHKYALYKYLLAIPEYYERTQELKAQYWSYLTGMVADADVIKAEIDDSAAMNYLRWNVLGKPSNKDGSRFADTFDEAVENVKNWLKGRETNFTVVRDPVVHTKISSDSDSMEIIFDDQGENSSVRFAVWGFTNDQNDMKWYTAERGEDGILRATAQLADHGETGVYMIHVFTGSKRIAHGQTYVETIPEPEIKVTVSEDCTSMKIDIARIGSPKKVLVPVWSEVNNQDDLVWYKATRGTDGAYSVTVDLRDHNSAGNYIIHVYAESADSELLLATNAYVKKAVTSRIKAVVNEDCTEMKITLSDMGDHDKILVPVWSAENDQDDLVWYTATKNSDGTYGVVVDLKNHNSAGKYIIHVYAESAASDMLAASSCYVEKAAASYIRVSVNADGTVMDIKLVDIGNYNTVLVPVWSVENDQDDLVWYTATKNTDGTYGVKVDLRNHGSVGDYIIHVYAESAASERIAATTCYVEKAAESYITATVNEACTVMDIKLSNIGNHNTVLVPVWSVENNQDDLIWYTATKNSDGTYGVKVDLRNHNSAGDYIIHVYAESAASEMIAAATCYVEKEATSYIDATVNADSTQMLIKLTGIGNYNKVLVPVWSAENDQDDLIWYTATKNANGTYTVVVDLKNHNSAGDYIIHVYPESAASKMIAASTCHVEKAAPSYIKTTVNADCTVMQITLTGIGNYSKVLVPVWSVEDDQDDLVWYTAAKNADGTYSVTVDLKDHRTAGEYIIHVYAESAASSMIASGTCYVSKAAA